MGEHTRTEGGAVVCRYCNRTLTFNFIDRPADRCSCKASREARENGSYPQTEVKSDGRENT